MPVPRHWCFKRKYLQACDRWLLYIILYYYIFYYYNCCWLEKKKSLMLLYLFRLAFSVPLCPFPSESRLGQKKNLTMLLYLFRFFPPPLPLPANLNRAQGKRGIEKGPFVLPEFIRRTGMLECVIHR